MMAPKRNDWFQQTDDSLELGEDYENKAVKDHKYFVKVKSRKFVKLVRKHFGRTKNLSCLDIGCGTGETCVWLSKYFKSVYGVDYAEGMIASAKKRHIKRCHFEVLDSSKMKFKDGTFDVAVFFNVIHHIDSRKKLLQAFSEARRVVKDGGLVVVVDLNPYNPMTRHVVNTCEIDEDVTLGGFRKGVFPTTLTAQQCGSSFASTGLDVRYKDYFIYFPQSLSFLLPVEWILTKLPFGGLYIIGGVK